ncbi:MAG TPA: DUF4190 domain-containing protein [Agromyces sp.]|nr:DUF4190 domain-containing protein [Agromyces sp.]
MTDPNRPDQPGSSVPPPAPAYGEPAAPAYGQPAAYGQPSGAKTNTLAIISLVASIAGIVILWGIGSVVGVICGHISLSQIKKTGEQGRGMAVAGLIVGYVGIALAIIAVIIFFAIFAAVIANTNLDVTY